MISARSRSERAIAHVQARARGGPVDPASRIVVHFHPDRLHEGLPILRALARDGVYRSQFETRTTNGGATAHPGGDRWRWESRIFGGAYDDAEASERPKYGALDFRRRPTGAAPRFGSAFLRLRSHVMSRATFCYPDSWFDPTDFGTAARMSLVELASSDAKDMLDDYVEAQIHGPLVLAEDVDALVLDPCYRGTDVERDALALPCALVWHPGFRLRVEELRRHPDYRGVEHVELGANLAEDGLLTARVIGEAARAGLHAPGALKKLWHCVARFGG